MIQGGDPNGDGTFKDSEKLEYAGNFKKGKLEGMGSITNANGDEYTG